MGKKYGPFLKNPNIKGKIGTYFPDLWNSPNLISPGKPSSFLNKERYWNKMKPVSLKLQ